MKNNKEYISKILLFIIINISFFIVFMSSPLYETTTFCIEDSGIYQVIAKEILNGRILYKEVFDHKGPLIFFFYIIPLLFKNVNLATFTFDVLLYNIIFYLNYKIIKKENHFFTWFIIILELCLMSKFHANISPETFILLTYSYMNYWILTKKYLNPSTIQLILCGILTSLVFWIKFSLGVPIAIIYIYIIIKIFKNNLPQKKKYFIYPLIGFMIPTTILLMYFIFNNALSDLFYSYFLINTGYKNISKNFNGILSAQYIFYIVIFLCIMLLYNLKKKNTDLNILLVAYLLSIIPTFLMTGNAFNNYFIPFICLPIFINSLDIKINKYLQYILLEFLIIVTLFNFYNQNILLNNKSDEFPNSYQFAKDVNNEVDSISTLYFAGAPILENLKMANYKYPVFSNITYKQIPEMWNEVYDDISNKNIEYLVFIHRDIENFKISDFEHTKFFEKFNMNFLLKESLDTLKFILKINEQVLKNYEFFGIYDDFVVMKRIF